MLRVGLKENLALSPVGMWLQMPALPVGPSSPQPAHKSGGSMHIRPAKKFAQPVSPRERREGGQARERVWKEKWNFPLF